MGDQSQTVLLLQPGPKVILVIQVLKTDVKWFTEGSAPDDRWAGLVWTLSRMWSEVLNFYGKVSTDKPEGQNAIQRDADRLELEPRRNLKFSKAKCKVLHLGYGNSQYQYKLGDEKRDI